MKPEVQFFFILSFIFSVLKHVERPGGDDGALRRAGHCTALEMQAG